MMLTRGPDFDDATAKLSGTLIAPVRTVTPPAITRPTPTGVMFGPIPNRSLDSTDADEPVQRRQRHALFETETRAPIP